MRCLMPHKRDTMLKNTDDKNSQTDCPSLAKPVQSKKNAIQMQPDNCRGNGHHTRIVTGQQRKIPPGP